MEEGVFPTFENLSASTMDLDFMDELLLGGCWLETAGGSDFLQLDPPFGPSYFLPGSEINNSSLNPKPPESNAPEEAQGSLISNPPCIEPRRENSIDPQFDIQNKDGIVECPSQLERYSAEGCSEPRRNLWIGPSPFSPVRDRLFCALRHIKDSIENGDVLVQIWVPMKREGKQILTTKGQPCSFDHNSQRLANYRNVSMNYQFPAEENSNESVGLPGRVFLEKVPEWTPDVQYFSIGEYPRIGYAQQYNVHGTIALPIFERGSQSCLGVLEVVMTTQKIKYGPELENICKALEAVDLSSSEVLSSTYVKACNESYQAAVPEILKVLQAVCETHKLPLAQTWVPCIQQGKEGCRHSAQNYAYCVSTVDSAYCVTDHRIQGFHEACSEHHLFRGQGVPGQALMTNHPCFSNDVTTFSKKEYPLAHYAKIFGLRAAVAIRLRSIYSGTIDYVLEFFLPVDCQDSEEMLNSLSVIIQRVCRSLRVVTDKELEKEAVSQVGEVTCALAPGPSKVSQPTWIGRMMEFQQKGKSVQKEKAEELKLASKCDKREVVLHQQQVFSKFKQHQQDSRHKNSVECGEDSSLGEVSFSNLTKSVEKRRTKSEKSISLQVLREYFAGSLKDAAKNLGVCPTTLKRICRQHGITRWPSRKIKKVGHSLRKLQVVIDSVQGAEGAFHIDSFYTDFPELTSQNTPGTDCFSTKVKDHAKAMNTGCEAVPSPQLAEGLMSALAAVSKSQSSSCSQNSSSSLSCSIAKEQAPLSPHLTGSEDTTTVGSRDRAASEMELFASDVKEPGVLGRSQSLKFLNEHPSRQNLPALLKNSRHVSRDKDFVRVKVTYGEEKVRFSMQSYWRFRDLQQEIAKRFDIDDMSSMHLKYLDDDSDWVLLTCDADLEECLDIYKSSRSGTVKLSVNQVSQPNLGSSFGSLAPS